MKKSNLIAVLLFGVLSSPSTMSAEGVALSGNIGVMSNYIYRGMTQSNDKASVKIGFNSFYNGFYAGASVLTIDFDTDDDFEIDYYAGYTNQIDMFTYDVNIFVTDYDGNNDRTEEVALGLSFPAQIVDNLTLGITYAKGIDTAPDNFNLKASYDLKVATFDVDYNDYDTAGKASTIGLSKPFNLDSYTIDTAIKYTNFSTDNIYIKDQNNIYLVATMTF